MSYYISYDTIDQFTPETVHSDVVHNAPHNRLLNNDATLDTALYGVASRVTILENVVPPVVVLSTLVRITPVLIYKLAYTPALWHPGLPILAYKEYPAAENWANVNSYVTHSYTGAIPLTARSVFLNIGIISASQKSGFMNLRSVSPSTLFPEDTVCESISRSNNDDSAADNVTIEMPYEPSRQFQSYCGVSNYAWFSIALVGYRT